MNLKEITDKLGLKSVTNVDFGSKDVSGVYTSDLLSDVMANSKKGNLWVTLQTHLNIIAVATLKEISGIIVVRNLELDKDTVDKANEECVPIFNTDLNAFQISGKLYELGLR